ncbi:hypothetical protein N434_04983, partial [Rhizobium sp. UGM030330-04]
VRKKLTDCTYNDGTVFTNSYCFTRWDI